MFQIESIRFVIEPWAIAVIVVIAVAFIAFAIYWGIRAHKRQVATGREELVGRTAVVQQGLNPKGIVFIEGERWAAVSEEGRVKTGEEVVITRVEGLMLYVVRKQQRG